MYFAGCHFVATYQIAPWPLRLAWPMASRGRGLQDRRTLMRSPTRRRFASVR
jgi:hypothetical protein